MLAGIYCDLFRSIIGSVVPPLPASDCPLVHQRWESSHQRRRGWTGFYLCLTGIIKIDHFSLPGVSLAPGHLSCSPKPSWPSGWPARTKVFSSRTAQRELKVFMLCKGSPSLTTHWQSLHSTVGMALHLSPEYSLPPLTRFAMVMVTATGPGARGFCISYIRCVACTA